jgi:hypothetical protein
MTTPKVSLSSAASLPTRKIRLRRPSSPTSRTPRQRKYNGLPSPNYGAIYESIQRKRESAKRRQELHAAADAIRSRQNGASATVKSARSVERPRERREQRSRTRSSAASGDSGDGGEPPRSRSLDLANLPYGARTSQPASPGPSSIRATCKNCGSTLNGRRAEATWKDGTRVIRCGCGRARHIKPKKRHSAEAESIAPGVRSRSPAPPRRTAALEGVRR